jgi:hypothetical protein
MHYLQFALYWVGVLAGKSKTQIKYNSIILCTIKMRIWNVNWLTSQE